MKHLPFVLLLLCAAGIAISTFVEDSCGTPFIHSYVYGAWWFRLVWAFVMLVSVWLFCRQKIWKNLPSFILHFSFVVIFFGAITTALTGKKGFFYLREGEVSSVYIDKTGKQYNLPFQVRLDNFNIEYYSGTETPSDYVSQLTCTPFDGKKSFCTKVSMNHILTSRGFRFYQTSFDDDLKGSVFTVNYDPWGTSITYFGFILFCLGGLFTLCAPYGGFRRLLRHPLIHKGGLLFFLLLYVGFGAESHAALPVVKRVQADSLASRLVVYNGRVAPLNTLAKDFLQKLYGKSTYHGLSPEQVLSSWLLYPKEWGKEPIIHIKSKELRTVLKLDGKYASLTDLFEGTRYKMQPLWLSEPNKQSKLAKSILEVDEKVGLILMLRQGTLIQPVPTGTPRPSSLKIKAELLYNQIPFSKLLFMLNITLGLAAFGIMLWRMQNGKCEGRLSQYCWTATLIAITLFHTFGYGLRGYVSGGWPLSNGYETMLFVALAVLLIACSLQRRFPFIRPLGLLLSGFSLLVAYLSEMNPQITPLMPVLTSPWLSYHVSFIMVSYALFAFVTLNGIFVFFLLARRKSLLQSDAFFGQSNKLARQVEQLTLLSRLLLYPATFLLGVGIIMGAVWANISWGSYWSWDPKEVWALVAFIVYGITFHRKFFHWLSRPIAFHLYMVFAFAVVLMTYFGVNYLLTGMHSYA